LLSWPAALYVEQVVQLLDLLGHAFFWGSEAPCWLLWALLLGFWNKWRTWPCGLKFVCSRFLSFLVEYKARWQS
jgi:hypothetical protein